MARQARTQLVIEGVNRASSAFQQADRQLLNLEGMAKRAGAALLGAFSVGAITLWVRQAVKAADESRKLAQGAGLAVEEFTALNFAAGQSGVSTSALTTAMTRLNQTVLEVAQGGTSAAAQQFRALGIAVEGADGALRSSTDILDDIADKFAEMPDGIEKSAIAAELFGRNAGPRLVPMLNQGSEGLQALREQAERLGLVVSEEMAKQAEQFNDNMSAIAGASRGGANTVAKELLPTLNELSGLFLDVAEDGEAMGLVAQVLSGLLKGLATVVIAVASTFGNLGRLIGASAAAAAQAARGNFRLAAQIMRDVSEDNERAALAAEERIKKLWSGGFEEAGQQSAETVRKYRESQEAIRQAAEESHRVMSKSYTDLVQAAKESLKEIVDEEREALAAIKRLRDQRMEIERTYDEFLKRISGGDSEVEADFQTYQRLATAARRALADGDFDGVRENARGAADVLARMAEAGENTYGFAGLVKALQDIELAANDIEQSEADKALEDIQARIEDLTAKIDELEKIELSIDLPEEERQKAIKQMKALAEQLGKELSFTVSATPVGGGDTPGFASGGYIRGPGTGTSDSILARLSNGEYVVRAAAVRKYGTGLLDQLNGLQLPKYADGGMVSSAGSNAGAPVNINLGGRNWPLSGDPEVVAQMAKFFRTEALRRKR